MRKEDVPWTTKPIVELRALSIVSQMKLRRKEEEGRATEVSPGCPSSPLPQRNRELGSMKERDETH